MKSFFSNKIWLCAVLGCALLSTACSKEPATTSLQLSGYNHTDKSIGSFSISGGGGEGGEAGYLGPGQGGGGFTCCVSVPTVWRPSLKVTVIWDGWEKDVEKTITRVVQVPKYDAKTASTMDVHFLRSGEVKVFVLRIGLGHRDYPLKGKEAELKPGVPIEIIGQ
jgi:hypothetical protein